MPSVVAIAARPRRGHRQARARALQVGRSVEAAEPAVEGPRLVATQLLRAMQDHRCALGRVAELVDVGRDRVHALDPEVPRRHVAAEHLGERQHEAAHAGVDVTVGADRRGQCRDRRDRIDDALRVLRRRADHEHRALVDRVGHRLDVGRPVVADRHRTDRHAEQVRRLVERGVGRFGDDDLAELDAAFGLAAFAGGDHRALDRLGASAREEAGRGVGAVQQGRGPADHLALDRGQRRERDRVERVLVQVQRSGLLGDIVHTLAAVVDHPERTAVLPAGIADPLGDEVAHDLLDRPTGLRQFHGNRS
jgi:hypothetical protein